MFLLAIYDRNRQVWTKRQDATGPWDPASFVVVKGPLAVLPPQCRAARALLEWSQDDLAEKAEVSRGTVKNLEAGASVSARFARALRDAFEGAGVVFLGEGTDCDGVPVSLGVALRRSPSA